MSDDGETELTSEDKRILKHVADAAREEMPSRRGFIQGGTAAAALGALGFGAGSATAQTQSAGQVGTQNNPVDVEAASVNAADVAISNSVTDPNGSTHTGGALHLLRDAGFGSGDYLCLAFVQDGGTDSTSSNTYQDFQLSRLNPRPTWNNYFPSATQSQAVGEFRVDANGDAVDVRIFNQSDGETVLEQTGITGSTSVSVGPNDYTPTTTGNPVSLAVQFRNNDDTTSVTMFSASVSLGVIL